MEWLDNGGSGCLWGPLFFVVVVVLPIVFVWWLIEWLLSVL